MNESDQDVFEEMILNKNYENGIKNFLNTDMTKMSVEDSAKHRAAFFYKMYFEEEKISDHEEEEEEVEEAPHSSGKYFNLAGNLADLNNFQLFSWGRI